MSSCARSSCSSCLASPRASPGVRPRPPSPRTGPSVSISASTAPSRRRPTTSATGSSSSATSRPVRPRSTIPCRAVSSSTPAAGYRLWKNLAAGVAVSYFTRERQREHDVELPASVLLQPAADSHRRRDRREAHGNRRARPGDVPRQSRRARRPAAHRAVGRAVVLQRRAGFRDRGHDHRNLSRTTRRHSRPRRRAARRGRRPPSTSARM